MKCLLIYDIPDDRIRTKIATFCLDYGLDRVQYSAFMGDLSSNHQEELMLKLERRLGKAAGKIDLFPICREDWRSHVSICQVDEETMEGEPEIEKYRIDAKLQTVFYIRLQSPTGNRNGDDVGLSWSSYANSCSTIEPANRRAMVIARDRPQAV